MQLRVILNTLVLLVLSNKFTAILDMSWLNDSNFGQSEIFICNVCNKNVFVYNSHVRLVVTVEYTPVIIKVTFCTWSKCPVQRDGDYTLQLQNDLGLFRGDPNCKLAVILRCL